jgi:hypothetical protein
MPVVRIILSCLAGLTFFSLLAVSHAAEQEVVLQLASGRQFHGTIDATSTADKLVLRTTDGGLILWRPIRWERIERATINGQPVDVAKLREAAGVGSRNSGVGSRLSEAQRLPLLRKIEIKTLVPLSDQAVEEEPPVENPPPRVAMVAFDPFVANWDADVETDGLVVDIMPLDINRYVVPSSGTLEVELYSPQRRTLDLAPMSGGDTLELVERWTRAINPEDFGPGGVRLRLPFGAIHPELNPNWSASWYGLVHVRLAIPGQGIFEDSRDGVRIRPWAPNRDRLEMKTGQRFLPTENLGRRD